MIALYLLAAHLVGDFVLQTRWQAAGKFGWSARAVDLRTRHVLAYAIPFIPIAVVYGNRYWSASAFILGLEALHFLTDSRRFTSTLGDVVGWLFRPPETNPAAEAPRLPMTAEELQAAMSAPLYLPLEPNPWTPIPILIDQTLHVCQLALLGGLFLS